MSTLGTLTLKVVLNANDEVAIHHLTDLAPPLYEMQGAMSGSEKAKAIELRRAACEAAAAFFLFLRNPD